MSTVDIDAVRERWGALAAGFIDLGKVPEPVLREKLTLLVADLDACVREIERLRPAVPVSVSVAGNGHPRHECDLGDECPMLRGDS